MQIVIDIPEETYLATCNKSMLPPDVENVVQGIKNGTPLPKGHGKLADVDAVIDSLKSIERLHIDDELRSNILNALYANTLYADDPTICASLEANNYE